MSHEAVVHVDVNFPVHCHVPIPAVPVGEVVEGKDNRAIGGVFKRYNARRDMFVLHSVKDI